MPTYEYYCPTNQQIHEVMHGMSRVVSTWGELCELADEQVGDTPADTPVEKLMSAGMIISGDKQVPDMGGGGCCGAGGCGSC